VSCLSCAGHLMPGATASCVLLVLCRAFNARHNYNFCPITVAPGISCPAQLHVARCVLLEMCRAFHARHIYKLLLFAVASFLRCVGHFMPDTTTACAIPTAVARDLRRVQLQFATTSCSCEWLLKPFTTTTDCSCSCVWLM
jgi:hypothetical protein